MKGFFLDGASTVGKTTILSNFMHKLNLYQPKMSKLFISEHYTQRMLEHLRDKDTLSGKDIKTHFDNIISSLSVYNEMLINSKFSDSKGNADMFVVLERGILTHIVTHPYLEEDYKEAEITQQLKEFQKMGIKYIFLKMPEEKFVERIKSSIENRNSYWKIYLDKLGGINKAVEYFINRQNSYLLKLKEYSKIIDTIIININNDDYTYFANKIYYKFK